MVTNGLLFLFGTVTKVTKMHTSWSKIYIVYFIQYSMKVATFYFSCLIQFQFMLLDSKIIFCKTAHFKCLSVVHLSDKYGTNKQKQNTIHLIFKQNKCKSLWIPNDRGGNWGMAKLSQGQSHTGNKQWLSQNKIINLLTSNSGLFHHCSMIIQYQEAN